MKPLASIIHWLKVQKDKYEKRMKDEGICPDCRGRGHMSYMSPYDGYSVVCPSCRGTGLHEDSEKTREIVD